MQANATVNYHITRPEEQAFHIDAGGEKGKRGFWTRRPKRGFGIDSLGRGFRPGRAKLVVWILCPTIP